MNTSVHFHGPCALVWQAEEVLLIRRPFPLRASLTGLGVLLFASALWLPRAAGRARPPEPADTAPPAMPDGPTDLRSGTCTPGPGYTDRGDDFVERLEGSNARAGSIFAERILEAYVAAAEGVFFHGSAPPKPIMRWMPLLSLGGRLGPSVPESAVAMEPLDAARALS